MYVNKRANSRLALNLSFNIITIFSLIYNKSRCDQRKKKNSNKTADSLQENFFKTPGIFSVYATGRQEEEVSKTLVCDRKITVPFEVSPELPGFSVQMVSAQGLGEIMNI